MRLARGTPRPLLLLPATAVLVRPRRWGLGLLVAAAALLAFFRDPERRADGPGVLAPADGKVQEVVRDGERWRLSIYLSLRDIHVTRAPFDATVDVATYRPGRFRPAFHPSSSENQRLEWTLSTAAGPANLIQYSGSIARRIVPYVEAGGAISRGERVGLIRFGSRVDVHLPAGCTPVVRTGDRVRAGRTVVGTAP